MNDRTSLIKHMKNIINERGGKAVDIAKSEIAQKFAAKDDVSIALKYFSRVTFRDALPVFPALVALACEAADAKSYKEDSIGGAITLIAAAADLHDDIIDDSQIKNGKNTVLGKFGKDVAILAGDAILACGLARLQKECESIPKDQRSRILDLMTNAILEMSKAEAQEARLRKERNLTAEDCVRLIGLKAVVPDTSMRIGAVLANGDDRIAEALGHFGKVFGIVSTVSEEFMDVLEFEELKNRLENHNPPLPFLYSLQDPRLKERVSSLSENLTSRESFNELKELVLNSPEASKLTKEMTDLVENELSRIQAEFEESRAIKELTVVLRSSYALLGATNY